MASIQGGTPGPGATSPSQGGTAGPTTPYQAPGGSRSPHSSTEHVGLLWDLENIPTTSFNTKPKD